MIDFPKKRDHSFDAFKGIAIIAVIAIHATKTGWNWYGRDSGEWNFYYTLIIKQLFTFAVPSFFFVAGYFAVNYEEIKSVKFIAIRLQRILIPYLFWSMVVLFLIDHNFDVPNFFQKIVSGTAKGPYYYIVTLTCLTVLTPLLLGLQKKEFGIVVIFIVNFLDLLVIYYYRLFTINGLSWYESALPFTSWILFYYLGIVARKKDLITLIPQISSHVSCILFIFFALSLSILEGICLVHFGGKSSGGLNAVKFSSFLYSFSIISYFLVIKSARYNFPNMLLLIGKCSFGIYLIHELFRYKISRFLACSPWIKFIQPVHQFLVVLITLTISLCIIVLTQKIVGKALSKKLFGF